MPKNFSMKIILYTLPVSLLVAYSQIVIKWRSGQLSLDIQNQLFMSKVLSYLSDKFILSAYAAALLGSFAWLVVVTKLPLSIGFPVYIGITFLIVILGSWLILGEQLTVIKLISALTIFIGIVIGASE